MSLNSSARGANSVKTATPLQHRKPGRRQAGLVEALTENNY